MSARKTWRLAAGLGMLVGWLGWAQEARAIQNPAFLNIDVTITQTLSVAVSFVGNQSSTQTVSLNLGGGPNQFLVSPSTISVINDSGGSTERWQLSTNAKAYDTTGGAQQWTLVTSTSPLSTVGPEDFALQAVFGSSNTAVGGCPIGASADWGSNSAAPITTALQTYTAALFADSSLNTNGSPNPDSASPNPGEMNASSQRALCWRVISPQSTAFTHTQNIQLIITALAP